MDQPQGQAQITPQGLMRMHLAMAPARVLSCALQLDLFSRLAEGLDTVPALAQASAASERGTRMLLDALCALGLATKSDGRYRPTAEARTYLDRASSDYLGALMETDDLWNAWTKLADAVRTGRPVWTVERQERAEQFFPILIRTLHVLNREPARRLAKALEAGRKHPGLSVLDVACGSAVWSIAIAESDPTAHVTAHDFPGILHETRNFVLRHGLADRFDFLAGDLKEVDFGSDRYDLAILGNIVHSEGEHSSRDLFRRLHRALRAQGRLAIIDFVVDEDRTGPPPAVFFALNMLVNTECGDTYTLSEYRAWLHDAGFVSVQTADIGSQLGVISPAIIGTKE